MRPKKWPGTAVPAIRFESMSRPLYCRPCAFDFFAAQLPLLDSDDAAALVNAAIAISMHELEHVDPRAASCTLQRLADEVCRRVPHQVQQLNGPLPPGSSPMQLACAAEAVMAHLHHVLFEEFGLRGNAEDYYNPMNSYIPAVLATRRGVPITLSLIYKVVAQRLGLRVHGVNAPGHFLAAVELPAASGGISLMYVDAFTCGNVLTREEAFARIEQAIGRSLRRDVSLLAFASSRQWLGRMLQNLQNIFAFKGRETDLAAMREMQSLLSLPC